VSPSAGRVAPGLQDYANERRRMAQARPAPDSIGWPQIQGGWRARPRAQTCTADAATVRCLATSQGRQSPDQHHATTGACRGAALARVWAGISSKQRTLNMSSAFKMVCIRTTREDLAGRQSICWSYCLCGGEERGDLPLASRDRDAVMVAPLWRRRTEEEEEEEGGGRAACNLLRV
jgi:hypothetical protein